MAILASTLVPNPEFARAAPEEQLVHVAQQLRQHGFGAQVVGNAAEALEATMKLIPLHAEVLVSSSATLEAIGLPDRLSRAGEYDLVKPKLIALMEAKDARGTRKLGSAPDVVVGSVHAVTEDGEVLIGSASGSQLGPYASGSEKVIWVVGAQKVVKDLATGLRRLHEYAYPMEDARARAAYGMPSSLAKILIVAREIRPDRVHMILVKDQLGF